MALPLEVQERVIDHLEDDVQNLRQCARLCRAWYIRSRVYLLRRIQVTSSECLDEICAYFRVRRSLCSLVGSIKILSKPGRGKSSDMVWAPLLSLFPRIACLNLSTSITDAKTHVSFHPTILTCLKHHTKRGPLHSLSLTYMAVRNPLELLRLLAALPSLRTLYCANVRSMTRASGAEITKQYSTRVFLDTLFVSLALCAERPCGELTASALRLTLAWILK